MKIEINVKIKSSNGTAEENTIGIFNKNNISYIEKNKTKVIVDMKNNILKRETKDLKLILDFNKKNNSVVAININNNIKKIKLNIKTNYIKKSNNYYNVDYTIEGYDDFFYTIKYKKINS